MKPCQLCGARSWGPVPGFVNDQACAPQTYLIGKELDDYRCCDHCGSFATLALIEERSTPALPPPPSPLDHMLHVQRVLGASLPLPETRTERLVRALLVSPVVEKLVTAQQMMELIRDIEKELDRPATPEPLSDSLYRFQLRFTDRVALETWVAAGLHDTDCPTHIEKELAHQFADWVEERHR